MNAVTLDTGLLKGGIKGTAVYTGTRQVFLGRDCVPTNIPEYTFTYEHDGKTYRREFLQVGRDIELEISNGEESPKEVSPEAAHSLSVDAGKLRNRVPRPARRLQPE